MRHQAAHGKPPPPGRPMGLTRFALRQLRATPALLLIGLVAGLGTLLVTAGPRLLDQVGDDDLRAAITDARPEQRNLVVTSQTRVGGASPTVPFRWLEFEGDRIFEEMPPSVAGLIERQQFVFDTPSFRASSFPDEQEGPFPTFITFRYQQDLDTEFTLVDGALPEPRRPIPMLRGRACPEDVLDVEDFELDVRIDCRQRNIPVFEIAISTETAELADVEVGDQLMLNPNIDDRLWFSGQISGDPPVVSVVISGLVEFSDRDRGYWFADTSLHAPTITENADFRLIFATAVIRPDQYLPLLRAVPGVDWEYEWRYFVDGDRVDAADADELIGDIERLDPPRAEVRTQLDEILRSFLERRRLAVQLTSAGTVGLGVAIAASIWVFAILGGARLRPSTVLARGRGAAMWQALAIELVRAAAVVAPAVLIGYVIALALTGDAGGSIGRQPALVFAVAALVGVVAAGLPAIVAPLGALQSRGQELRRTDPRVVVAQAMVVIVAVGAVLLVRRRGAPDPAQGDPDFDLLLAATPALVGVAAGIVALHLASGLVRVAQPLAERTRSVAGFLAMRRMRSAATTAAIPVLVIVVATAMAIFATVIQTSIREGQIDRSWEVVGADYRVEGLGSGQIISDTMDLSGAGLDTLASAALVEDVTVIADQPAPPATVFAVESVGWHEILAGSDLAVDGLLELDRISVDGVIPALTTGRWPGDAPPDIGARLELTVAGTAAPVEVTGTFPSVGPLPDDLPALVVDLDALRRSDSDRTVPATAVLAGGPADAAGPLAEAIGRFQSVTRVESRHELQSEIADGPLARWTRRGLFLVAALSVVLAAIAAATWVAMTTARNRRDVGILGTLGLEQRGAARLLLAEHLPLALASVGVGLGVGIGVAQVLDRSLGLESFTRQESGTPLVISPAPLITLTVIVIAALVAAIATFVFTQRDATVRAMLKIGDES